MATNFRREEIERRAYELYEQRGRKDGRDWDDWLQAEREMNPTEIQSEVETIAPEPTPRRQEAEREVEFA